MNQNEKMDHMKMNFEYLQIQKWLLQNGRAEKEDEKKWGHLSRFHVFFLSYSS